MPASSANLLKVLSEDPSAFEKDIGCMKGIFQIFDRHHTFSGRHYGSKRLASENGGGKSLPATSDAGPRHQDSSISSSCMVASFHNSRQLNPAREYAAEDHHHHHRWSSIDSNGKNLANESLADLALESKVPQADQESDVNTRPHLSFYFRKPTPTIFQNSKLPKGDDGSQHVHSFSVQQEVANNWGAAPTTPRASVDGRQTKQNIPKTSSSSVEMKGYNVPRASSFYREKVTDHNCISQAAMQSLHLEEDSSAFPTLKKLTRSVSGRDKLQVPSNGKLSPVNARMRSRSYVERYAGRLQDSMEFPYSGSLRETDTKDPRFSIKNDLRNMQHSFDGNDVSGLKLDLQECPSLSVSTENERISPLGWSTTLLPEGPDNSSHFKKQACVVLGSDIRDTMRVVSDCKVSTDTQKERVSPHCSVDRTRDSPQVFTAGAPPRLSVDGRDVTKRNNAELQENSSEGMHHGGPSVVARLMGLEELPNCSPSLQKVLHTKPPSREAKLIQGLFQSSPLRLITQPSLRPSDNHASSKEKDTQSTRTQVEGYQEPMPRPKSPLSPKHLLIDRMPPPIFRQQVAQQEASKNCHLHLKKQFMEAQRPGRMPLNMNPLPSPEPLHGGLAQQLQQLWTRNSVKEWKTLKQILETIQLKGLLHPSHSKQPTGTNFFSDSKSLLLPKVAVSIQGGLAQMDLAGYQESPGFGEAQVTMDTKRQEHLAEGLLNTARTIGHEKLGDACSMLIRPINTKPPVRPQASNRSAFPAESMELDRMPSKSGSSANLVMAGMPKAHTNDGETMKRASAKTGGQRSSCPRLQPKGNVEMPKGATEAIPRTPRSPQLGNVKPVASPSVREQQSPRPGSPSQAVAFGSGSKRLLESPSSQEQQSPRPGSPSQGVAFGRGPSKQMLQTVRSPQAKSMLQSQASQELVKGRPICIGPESPRMKRPSVIDSKPTSSRVQEHPKYQSLKDPVDVTILKSKQFNKLAKARLARITQPITDPTSVTTSSQATVEKCSESKSRSLLPRRLSFGPDQSSEVVKDLVSEKTTVYAERNNNQSLDVKTLSNNFLVKQARDDSKPECDFDSEEVRKQVQSMKAENENQRQGIKLPILSMKHNLGADLSTSTPCVSGPPHQGSKETGDVPTGLEERKLVVVWSEKRPSEAVTSHKDLMFEKCRNFSENDQYGDGFKQPSPMSVLDSTFFGDEERTVITPRAKEYTIQDALIALENIKRSRSFTKALEQPPLSVNAKEMSGVRAGTKVIGIVEADDEAVTPGEDKHEIVLKETPDTCCCFTTLPTETHHDIETMPDSASKNRFPSIGNPSLRNREAEREFVRELIVASGLTNLDHDGNSSISSFHMKQQQGYIIDPAILVSKSDNRRQWKEKTNHRNIFEERYNEERKRKSLQHCLLLDTVNEILVRKYQFENSYTQQPWVYMPPSQALKLQHQKPKGQNLVEEVWEQMQGMMIPCAVSSNDVCDTVQSILERDIECLSNNAQESWLNYEVEHSKLELELEQMIFKDLINEAVEELKTCFGNSNDNCFYCCCCGCCCCCCHQHHQHRRRRRPSASSCNSRNSLQFPKKVTARRQLLFMH